MARSHLRQAQRILIEAEHHYRDEAWHLVVRRCQEAVELALKAVLRATGVEIPRVDDVGVFLREHAASLPATLTTHLDRLVSVSRSLRNERETSFYGDDQSGAPPDQLYAALDAESALRDARFVVELCSAVVPR